MGNWDSESGCAIHIHGPAAAGPIPFIAWRLGGGLAKKSNEKKKSPPKGKHGSTRETTHPHSHAPPAVCAGEPTRRDLQGGAGVSFSRQAGKKEKKTTQGEDKTASSARGPSVSGPHAPKWESYDVSSRKEKGCEGLAHVVDDRADGGVLPYRSPTLFSALEFPACQEVGCSSPRQDILYPYHHHPPPMPS